MFKFIRAASTPLVLLAFVAACGKQDQATPETRQVELTPSATAQPQLGDTATAAEAKVAEAPAPKPAPTPKPKPAAPTPVAAAPKAEAPAPAPAKPTTGVIAGGMTIATDMGTRVCTNTHKVGDRVTATLESAVPGTNGATIPAGATVTLRISESQRGENGKEGIRLAVEPVSVTFGGATYAIDGSAELSKIDAVRAQSTGDQAKKVATGAAIGAIAGQIMGKRAKTAAIGAVVGAAAGGAVAAGSSDWNGCVADGAKVSVTLRSPVTVKIVTDKPGI